MKMAEGGFSDTYKSTLGEETFAVKLFKRVSTWMMMVVIVIIIYICQLITNSKLLAVTYIEIEQCICIIDLIFFR